MTRSNPEHFRGSMGDFPDDNVDTTPIPVIDLDVTDGYGTGLKLTEAVKTLASEAKEIGIPQDSDGALLIGDRRGDHLIVEQDVIPAEGNNPADVINTLVVAAPSKNAFFRFSSHTRNNGELVKFQVTEENQGNLTREGEFSGPNGSELPQEAINPTIHLTETMLEVTNALRQADQISEGVREDLFDSLTSPETAHRDRATKVMGSTALGRLLTKVGIHHSAA